jgi:spermidine synthase
MYAPGWLEKFHMPYITLAALVLSVNFYLFRLYHRVTNIKDARGSESTRSRLEFSPEDLGGFSLWKLTLASIGALFLELLLIRWISSEIHVFAYFKNFVLIACFLGFGLGCYLCRRRIHLLAMGLPLIAILMVVKFPWESWHIIIRQLPSLVGDLSEVDVRGFPTLPANLNAWIGLAKTIGITVPLFSLIVFTFIPFGQLVGWHLEESPKGIRGYTFNIVGSLVGILAYTALCFLDQPPTVWFTVAGGVVLLLLWRVPVLRWTAAIAFAICVFLVSLGPNEGYREYWSPYQKLTLRPLKVNGELVSYELKTNDSWYQQIFDLSPEFVAKHSAYFREVSPEWTPYNLPYKFYPKPGSVLVLGAGTGNDVAAALRNGAQRVVAVEIDPLIRKLGGELHFERPYSSSKVQTVVDDARSYVQNSQEKFDLIMFSLLDSHTTSSYYTNIRIDNYVYTQEALVAAKRLLKPDGLLIVKFFVETPWIAGRLEELTTSAFGRHPLHIQATPFAYSTAGRFFIAGSSERIQNALADPKLAEYVRNHQAIITEAATLTTDDWPFFYQHEPGLPSAVIILSLVLLILGWLFLRDNGISGTSINWHFFFLGAGFMLLEAQIISKMALLFGTTWVVNSIVISALMLLIVAANVLVERYPNMNIRIVYVGIFLSMVLGYLVPLEWYFFGSFWLKILSATTVLCLPVFFAGMVFIESFARAGFRGTALGSNLMGALTGGLLESLSAWTGIRSLLIIAALLYLFSLLARSRGLGLTSTTGEAPAL